MATVTVVPLLGFVGSYGKSKCLTKYAKCCGDEAEGVNVQTAYYKGQHCCTFTCACGGCATSDPSPSYRGGVKGDLCAGFVLRSKQGKARSKCSHR